MRPAAQHFVVRVAYADGSYQQFVLGSCCAEHAAIAAAKELIALRQLRCQIPFTIEPIPLAQHNVSPAPPGITLH